MAEQIRLIDEQSHILLSLEFLNKQAGSEVFSASNGETALDKNAPLLPDSDVLYPRYFIMQD